MRLLLTKSYNTVLIKNNRPSHVITDIVSTSGRLLGEFLWFLFLQTHRETDHRSVLALEMNLIHDHGSEFGKVMRCYLWEEHKSMRTRSPGTVGKGLYHSLGLRPKRRRKLTWSLTYQCG